MWLWIFLGLGAVVLTMAVLVRAAIRKYTSTGLAWAFACLAGFGIAGYCGANSTEPSSATRITAVGMPGNCTEHRSKSNIFYSFLLVPTVGAPINLESRIEPPLCWQGAEGGYDGRVYRIVFLDERDRYLKNEAIGIEVVKGQNFGWKRNVDARPFGLWLGIPAGFALVVIGGVGMVRNRRLHNHDSIQAGEFHEPVEETNSDLTDLKL